MTRRKRTVASILASAGAAATATPLLAHPGPRIWIGSAGGQIVTFDSDNDLSPTTYSPSRVFVGGVDEDQEDSLPSDGLLKEYPVPGTGIYASEFPGYQVRRDGQAGFGTGKSFGFDLAGPLLVYNDATHLFETTRKRFGTPGPAPQMGLSAGSSVATGSGPVSGFNFLPYNTAGDHGHLAMTLLGDGSNPVDGPQAVYALPMKLTGTGLGRSALYYVLVGRGIGYLDYNPNYTVFRDALDAVNATLTPEADWPGQWWADQNGNWSDALKWMPDVPDVADLPAQFLSRISAPRTVTVDGDFTAGSLVFRNSNRYTLAGPGRVTLQSSTGPTAITVVQGSHTVGAAVELASDAQIGIAAGSTLTLSGDLSAAGRSISKSGAGVVEVKNIRAASLAVNEGKVAILPNGSATGTSRVAALSIASGARLDLGDNKLITQQPIGSWNGSAYSGVAGLVQSGRNGGTWSGEGIVTSQSAAIGGNYTSLGVARASDVRPATATATALWGGQTITGTDTLVMYTYGGDATLDGKINIDDYVKIDSGIAGGYTGWSNGDFNYDGKVSIDDYITVIDANVGNQNGLVFPTAGGVGGVGGVGEVTAVPEPGLGVGLFVLCASLLTSGRSRRAVAPKARGLQSAGFPRDRDALAQR